jgi:hypothetical protein
MHSNLDYGPAHQPDELPPSAKLQAGYVRYVRIKPEEGPEGEICLETCIRRSQSGGIYDEHQNPDQFHYTAISYAWGDATARHPVFVDGHKRLVATNLWHFIQRAIIQRTETQGTKEVRTELLASARASLPPPSCQRFADDYVVHLERLQALQRLGWPEDWLWIDALCIDQLDDHERTHQVGIMSEIFGRADLVISWLGPAYNNSEHAMTAISYYSDKFPVNPIISPTELSEAICSLCERPYWKRLWVFQELKHARHIMLMCGKDTIFWNVFRNVWSVIVDTVTTSEDASDRLRESLATRMMALRTKPMDFSLWNLLKETKNLECADRRDRVYALLSVAA